MKKQLKTTFSNRQYMLSSDYEIYYYYDFPKEAVAPHKHNNYEFYFLLEGEIELSINHERYPIKAGDFVIFPPETNHFPILLSKEKPYRRFVLWISTEYCNQLLSSSKAYAYLMQYVATNKKYLFHVESITSNTIQSMIFRLIEELRGNRFGKEAETKLQINSFILYLNRIVYEQNTGMNHQYEKNLYLNICNFIHVHLEEDLSLDRLANEFFVNKFHISHAFKDNIGIPLHQYIIKKRLKACKDALLSTIPITKVFQLYGFHDYSSFYRAFKKEYGISPKEYKEIYQITNI